MMISEDLLLEYGGKQVSLPKDHYVFREGDTPKNYFQIKQGEVTVININEKGDEFVQGIFHPGQSFGEPPVFGDFPYPASAKTSSETVLLVLNRTFFLQLLKSDFETHFKFTSLLSKRMMYKSIMIKEIARESPEHRIMSLLRLYVGNESNTSIKINLSRQQIANLTGLRVETVIRTMKKLEETGSIRIEKGKVYL